MTPPEVPIFGFDDTMGTSSHGDEGASDGPADASASCPNAAAGTRIETATSVARPMQWRGMTGGNDRTAKAVHTQDTVFGDIITHLRRDPPTTRRASGTSEDGSIIDMQ